MKRTPPVILYLLLYCCLSSFEKSLAQRPTGIPERIAITGWTDDTHYMFRTLDNAGNPVIRSADINTGRSINVPRKKSERDLLIESLPSGETLGINHLISPDMKTVLLIKENDLFCFVKGEKELRRLTSDKAEEVNSRYSPDGRKIAYTKNRDLYVFDLVSNKEIRLTTDASERVYNGYSSWVYMEEILGRDSHYAAFW